MQAALSASAGFDLGAPSSTSGLKNKILIGGVAALTAGMIAVGPAVQNGTTLELHQAQQRTVELASLVNLDVTGSPLAVYGGLLNNTAYNLQGLLSTYAANPAPILRAVVENQVGYLKRVFDLSVVSTAFQTWWNDGTRESAPGKQLVESVGKNIAAGDFFAAYENLNKLVLFGIQNTVLPWLNNWLFSSTTQMGVPQQILQNLSDAVGTFFTTGTLVYGAFQAVYAPISGAFFELSRSLGTVGQTLLSGNLVGAISGLVNTPGVLINAFVNGFDYSDTASPWAGLLSWRDPSCTGRCASGGPISEFFITIAQKLAAAIKNTSPVTAPATAAVAAAPTTLVSSPIDTNAVTITLDVDGAAAAGAAAESGSAASEDAPSEVGAPSAEPEAPAAVVTDDADETEAEESTEVEVSAEDEAATEAEAGTEAETGTEDEAAADADAEKDAAEADAKEEAAAAKAEAKEEAAAAKAEAKEEAAAAKAEAKKEAAAAKAEAKKDTDSDSSPSGSDSSSSDSSSDS